MDLRSIELAMGALFTYFGISSAWAGEYAAALVWVPLGLSLFGMNYAKQHTGPQRRMWNAFSFLVLLFAIGAFLWQVMAVPPEGDAG